MLCEAQNVSLFVAINARDEQGNVLGLTQHDDALSALPEALRITPEDATDAAALVSAYRELLHIKTEDVDAWSNLGDLLASLDRYDDAILAYREALRINPEHATAWNCSARSCSSPPAWPPPPPC